MSLFYFRKSKILGIGNPLLDLTVVGDAELLKKYELEPNNAILATDVQKPMYEDLLKNHEVQFSAGGSVLNALRVCQWIIGEPKICVFMGAVGNDQYSGILESVAKNDGVDVIFQFHEGIPTGMYFSRKSNVSRKY